MASWLNLRVFQKLCHRLVERFRNFSQIEDRDIALATFDTSHVGAINLGQISKRLLGPKSVQSFVEKHAPAIVAFALDRPGSWTDETAYRSWKKSVSKKHAGRFAVFTDSVAVGDSRDTLGELESREGSAVVTVVDLLSLGNRLADELRARPSDVSVIGKAEDK